MTYKQWDKVMYNWEECTYIGEYRENCHLIDWLRSGHSWKCDQSESRAKKVWYSCVLENYWYVGTHELSPVSKKKVTDLWEKEVIHCETAEEAIRITKIMHNAWLRWENGAKYVTRLSLSHCCAVQAGICYKPIEWKCAVLGYYKKIWNKHNPLRKGNNTLWNCRRSDTHN